MSDDMAYLSSLQHKEGNLITAKPKETLLVRVASARKSGEELPPTDSVSTIFPDQPPLNCLHVIVRKPDAGE